MTIWNMEITASESPQTVHIPLEGKYYAIKNSGEHDILVSSSVAGPTEGADDVMKIPSGSAAIIPVKDGDLYVSAEEDGTYSVSIQDDKVIPWSGGTGSGGDNAHYKGTTTTPLENGSTTNPIVIDGESYTAVFGDVVVYGYTEFVFDGTQWSEFGRPFDTTPTSGSANAVTSDGIYKVAPWNRGEGKNSAVLGNLDSIATKELNLAAGAYCHATGARAFAQGQVSNATGDYSSAIGYNVTATGVFAHALNYYTVASQTYMTAIGKYNKPRTGDLFNVGNGTSVSNRSNILEVSGTDMNVNGGIQINGVNIPTPYTTMPTITADMLGKIAMYVGVTGNGYTQGCFYIAATDGAAEPTYSWVQIGGGYKETTLYLNEGQTTPETITLTESFRNYDALEFVAKYYNTTGTVFINEHPLIVTTSSLITGESLSIVQTSASSYCTYWITDNTHFAKHDVQGFYLYSIKGIKY